MRVCFSQFASAAGQSPWLTHISHQATGPLVMLHPVSLHWFFKCLEVWWMNNSFSWCFGDCAEECSPSFWYSLSYVFTWVEIWVLWRLIHIILTLNPFSSPSSYWWEIILEESHFPSGQECFIDWNQLKKNVLRNLLTCSDLSLKHWDWTPWTNSCSNYMFT